MIPRAKLFWGIAALSIGALVLLVIAMGREPMVGDRKLTEWIADLKIGAPLRPGPEERWFKIRMIEFKTPAGPVRLDFHDATERQNDPAAAAVRSIGKGATPLLMRMAQDGDETRRRRWYIAVRNKLPNWAKNKLAPPKPRLPTQLHALYALGLLETNAVAAAPMLVSLLERDQAQGGLIWSFARQALMKIDPNTAERIGLKRVAFDDP